MPSPPSSTPAEPSGLMTRLRAATDAAHRRLEAQLRVEDQLNDPQRYAALLQLFHAIYRPLERALERRFQEGVAGLELAPRRKHPWLEQDLRALNAPLPESEAAHLPPLENEMQALGCLYVLEGSTLGGQMIARMVARALGFGPESGGRFFHGYGAETGTRWRAFGSAADAFPAAPDIVVASANATFAAFERHAAHHPSFR